ncbi:MAG: hypothetical protein OJF49_002944 [Ktedonobacterales bacterium]|nr:MAG: hypothetical protein OJF49_002944 [Ktedonobacterales bacterium]
MYDDVSAHEWRGYMDEMMLRSGCVFACMVRVHMVVHWQREGKRVG